MKVMCDFEGYKIVFENGVWSTKDVEVEDTVSFLNREMTFREDEFPGDWHPDPEIAIAKLLIEPMGGKVITEFTLRDFDPNVIY